MTPGIKFACVELLLSSGRRRVVEFSCGMENTRPGVEEEGKRMELELEPTPTDASRTGLLDVKAGKASFRAIA